jgi:hypothetical protein
MRVLLWVVALFLMLTLLATGCGVNPAQGQERLPPFVYSSAQSLEGYRLALAQPELLAQMPCYCGCRNLSGGRSHKSLKDCYFKADGSLDDHASTCDLCNKIALDAGEWQKQGLSVKDIRKRVDEKYSRYGQPTDTPPVE